MSYKKLKRKGDKLTFADLTRDAVSDILYTATGCAVQHDVWPCGTCFFGAFPSGTFDNSDWQALLFYRGDYDRKDLTNLPDDVPGVILKIFKTCLAMEK